VSLRLVDLDCPSCGSALRGEGLDTLFFCGHCGAAATLGESGVELVDSSALLPTPGRRAELWRPAWRLDLQVRVHQRFRADGRQTEGWEGRRRFFIPAFELGLDDLTRLARALTEIAETTTEVPREPIRGGTLSAEDAVTLARHLLIGAEARRSDLLASVIVDIDELARSLVAIPFERVDQGLRCAVTGVTVLS
jgi:hypothetical protein